MSKEDLSCDRCGNLLNPVFDNIKRREDFPQFSDALVIDIRGGYGMYIDEPPTRVILDKNCADELFESNGWLRSFMALYAGNLYPKT